MRSSLASGGQSGQLTPGAASLWPVHGDQQARGEMAGARTSITEPDHHGAHRRALCPGCGTARGMISGSAASLSKVARKSTQLATLHSRIELSNRWKEYSIGIQGIERLIAWRRMECSRRVR